MKDAADSPVLEMPKPIRDKKQALKRKFIPRFWKDADSRCHAIREIQKRIEKLKKDAGADSYQKELLVHRAVFISVLLETQERAATETGSKGGFEIGVYTQGVNALMGLLKALGLDRKVRAVGLSSYMEGKAG